MTPPAVERPDPFVLLRFLEALYREEGVPAVVLSRSRLQRAARVNYDIFRRYLALMVERGFLEESPDRRGEAGLRITEEGRRFYRQSLSWVEAVFGRGGF